MINWLSVDVNDPLMDETIIEQKRRLIKASRSSVDELIKIAESVIINDDDNDDDGSVEYTLLAADKMKNAAAAKKLAIFDAFDIMDRVELEEQRIQESLENKGDDKDNGNFAERFSKK